MLQLLATVLAFGARAAAGAPQDPPAVSPTELRPPDRSLNLNVHVYGFSYHTDRQGARRSGVDNPFNVGLGLNYTAHEDERDVVFVEAGFYRDSGSRLAKIVGVGYQYKLDEHWRLGAALLGVHSPTYNQGRAFIAPLPILTYDLGAVKLNAIYVPRYRQYNQFAVFGLYFSLPLPR